jgi:hypothetical protein
MTPAQHAVLTIAQCFDEAAAPGLADRARVEPSRRFLRGARTA